MSQHKHTIRQDMRERRRRLPSSWVDEHSRQVHAAIETWHLYRNARAVMFYAAFGNEVLTAPLMERALAAGRTVAVPRIQVVGRRMTARAVNTLSGDLEPGAFGIPAPAEDAPIVEPDLLDMVIVPGLAFDRRGYRVGFGGGYYDRFLAGLEHGCAVVGMAFAFQVVDAIAEEEHDLPVHYVATEDGIIPCRGG